MKVASGTTNVLKNDGNDDHHKPGEVVEVVCESSFVFYAEIYKTNVFLNNNNYYLLNLIQWFFIFGN